MIKRGRFLEKDCFLSLKKKGKNANLFVSTIINYRNDSFDGKYLGGILFILEGVSTARRAYSPADLYSPPPRGESVQALDKVALDSFNKASQHPLSPSGEIKYIYIDRRNVRQILINERATDPSMVTAFLHVYTKGK